MSKVSALVADDASFIRDLMREGLRNSFSDLHIEGTMNGRKAQQLLSRQNVSLVLCDWEMPKMPDPGLLAWRRTQENLKATPFIVVTSHGDKENVVQTIQTGMSDYIGKPFSNDQLVAKVKEALGRSDKLGALAVHAPHREIASGMASDSPAALIGGCAKVIRPATSPVKPVPAPRPASTLQASVRPASSGNPPGQAQLHLPQSSMPCVIETVSPKEAQLVVKRADPLPQVLESAMPDLEESSDIARLNGYLHAIVTLKPKSDSDWLLLTLRFVDRDPQGLGYLSRLIARGSAQEHYAPGT